MNKNEKPALVLAALQILDLEEYIALEYQNQQLSFCFLENQPKIVQLLERSFPENGLLQLLFRLYPKAFSSFVPIGLKSLSQKAHLPIGAILEQMKTDEAEHAATAIHLGGAELPALVKAAMQGMSKVMTSTTYHL